VAERVEIACAGGHGRTGTALACLAILDGVPGTEAVAFVREHYYSHAVETPGQRRYVSRWSAPVLTEPHPPGQLRLPPSA
jgi:protein-tyrosine phosphatase